MKSEFCLIHVFLIWRLFPLKPSDLFTFLFVKTEQYYLSGTVLATGKENDAITKTWI